MNNWAVPMEMAAWQIGGNAHHTNLGLCSDTVGAINPDVFRKDSTLLIEFHVFHELAMTVSR